MADRKYIVDLFDEVVDAIRKTGTITSSIESNGTYTITSTNTLLENWHVTIDSIDYEVTNVTASGFTVKGETGIDFAGETWKALEPYYDYGHIVDILKKLKLKDENDNYKFQKYPLIALVLDMEEPHMQSVNYSYSISPRILILAPTTNTYTSQERMENIFKPVLYPIWEDFITSMRDYEYFKFESPSLVPHTKIDRLYWGSEGTFGNVGTVFNDYLDGIQLDFDEFNITRKIIECN